MIINQQSILCQPIRISREKPWVHCYNQPIDIYHPRKVPVDAGKSPVVPVEDAEEQEDVSRTSSAAARIFVSQ